MFNISSYQNLTGTGKKYNYFDETYVLTKKLNNN